MKKKPSKANLFRFVTLRNPQLIERKNKDFGFVYFPTSGNSKFYTAIEGVDEAGKTAALKTATSTFSPLKNRREVRNQNQNLYDFSSWLMRNKSKLSFATIKENSGGVVPLTSTKELLIWENLLYQTLERESVYARESEIQMLIANKFLDAFIDFSKSLANDYVFTEEEEKEYIRRANASVVISKELYVKRNDGGRSNSGRRIAKDVDQASRKAVAIVVAKQRLAENEQLLKELEKAEVIYIKNRGEAYETALSAHENTVHTLIENAKVVLVEKIDTITGKIETKETYPDLELPTFSFTEEVAIDSEILSRTISKVALKTLAKHDLFIYDTFAEVKAKLLEDMTQDQTMILDAANNKTRKVRVGGVTLPVGKQRSSSEVDYNIIPLHIINNDGSRSIHMAIYNHVDQSEITEVSYTITFGDGSTVTSTEFSVNEAGVLVLTFFPNTIVFPADTIYYRLEGEIALENGDELIFNRHVLLTSQSNLGNFEVHLDGGGDGTNPEDPFTNQVYGVTNLGIADFRRVEQEVCCYVAGEVSHIENILAREYKERSTRNLNSIETTTEETTEREVENLKDTSTTERFEMQSEASSIINEDSAQDIGGSAGVNGKVGGVNYNANAYANFSSGSSTSTSNSQAQTYAEEVTERALERVVEKVTRKRTSRVLREFEETNTHGFDNRKGDQHVTGVYRWVDKIYNNQLINYGKRLMYEFAIPEPSKFFKEAIYKRADDGTTDDAAVVPVAPTHPRDRGLTAATIIHPSNYRGFAGPYNAEIQAEPQEYISVSEAFSIKGTEYVIDRNYPGASNFSMDVPDNYEVVSAYTTLGFSFIPNDVENYNYGAMMIGHRYGAPIIRKKNDKVTDYHFFYNNPIQKELAVGFHGIDVGGVSIGVIANCRRTSESYKQWQIETFTAIMNAYEDQLALYKDEVTSQAIGEVAPERVTFNPLYNRSIEKKEIKRIAIELLADQLGQNTDQNNYDTMDASTSVSRVIKNSGLQSHASTVKFFEQAFDWEIMAYLFYPYFYAEKENWVSLFQETEAADPIFQAFLQSGMARAVVPVRPGFEDAVNWYMETGELWEGQGLVIEEDSDLYISVSEEMQTVDGEVEREWETRVPTSLTIVQAESASLIEGGLPCFCEDKEEDNTITRSDAKLIGQAQQATEGGEITPPATF